MAKAAVTIELSEPERRELESLARAQKTGQALAKRARIVLAAADGAENKAVWSGRMRTRSANGEGGSPSDGWTGSTTSLARVRRDGSATRQLPRPSG